MKDWFADRSPREQMLFAGGSGILLIVLLWLLAWEPVSQERIEYEARVAREQVILLDLQQLASDATVDRQSIVSAAMALAGV